MEDCRHLSRRLEADLLAAGERIRRVPPKLMAKARDSARTYGKSDPIDALAVARAALREPDLPMAQLDGPARELRLLVDHREDLVKDRTGHINRLRWHLHELDPSWDPPARSITSYKTLDRIAARLQGDRPVGRSDRRRSRRSHPIPHGHRTSPPARHHRTGQLHDALPAHPRRCRAAHRSQDRRRGRRRPPLQAQRRLRPSQRHRPATGLVREPEPAPALPHRQPSTQRRHPPHRHHPALPPPRRRKPSEIDASPPATPEPKPFEPSSDDSQTSSSEPCSSTQNRPTPPISPTPLDIGANDAALVAWPSPHD